MLAFHSPKGTVIKGRTLPSVGLNPGRGFKITSGRQMVYLINPNFLKHKAYLFFFLLNLFLFRKQHI